MWEYGRFVCLFYFVFLPCHPFHRHHEHQDFREHFLHLPPSLPQPEQLCIGHNTGVIWPYLHGCLSLSATNSTICASFPLYAALCLRRWHGRKPTLHRSIPSVT